MSETPKVDKVSFPGGYDITDILVAVKLAAGRHVENVPVGETEQVLLQRYLGELAARHPDSVPFSDPYRLRTQELFDERRSLLNSHLKLSWFTLAYWAYGLVAVRADLSLAEYDGLHTFLTPVREALLELGVRVSAEECLAEFDRFIPPDAMPRTVEAATHTFLAFARFLHYGALRRRQVVTPGLTLPTVCLAFTEQDAEEACRASAYLTTHGIPIGQHPAELTRTARLLVLFSREAMDSELFWRSLADWKEHQVIPMVVCLMPKAELYRAPPDDWRKEVWAWLAASVAVELSSEIDRYVPLLRALDSPDPKQWWWNPGDAVELGLAVDVLGLGIPRPAAVRPAADPTGEPYPFTLAGRLLSACFVASDRLARDETSGRDAPYFATCFQLLQLRQKPNGEPYALPWFMLIYRAWLSFAGQLPGFAYSEEDAMQAEQELRSALFALGLGTDESEVPPFMKAFANLPWTEPPTTPAAVDQRTSAFIFLVFHLSQAALARTQRMRLRHPSYDSFVSYARADESFARKLVADLEAKGADVWWDLNAITLGTPLDGSLRHAVGDARFILLVATPAANKSPYVRLEVETAIREGLRVVPITPDGRIPGGLQALLDSAPDSIEPVISTVDSDAAATSILARLERSPSEQLRWIQSQAPYQNLRQHIARARASLA
ncbi:MAG TPA: toll/interleukin-1 receptor domain-containing protein [Thermoanaerobaculia bacterium]|nr:toll/interleukin-1 receptor domain-containing protein [Thermoanaerobaculia bacterium]